MESWKIVAAELIEKMSASQNHVLEFLNYLSELPKRVPKHKFKGFKGLTLDEKRCAVSEELHRLSPNVFQFLIVYTTDNYVTIDCSHGDIERQNQIFLCLSNWLSCDLIQSAEFARSKLFVSMLYYLGTPNTPCVVYKSACDCICEALILTRKDRDKHLELAQALFQGLHSVPEVCCLCTDECEAVEKSTEYCRVCTEFAKSLVTIITDTPGQGFGDIRTVDMILKCASNHCWQGVSITFCFWHKLSKILQRKQNNDLNNIFKPYAERLLESLCRRCQLDSTSTGTPDDSDLIAFRTEVAFIIRDVIFLVGATNCFQLMFNSLKNQGFNSTWDMSEASLFIMSTVAKNIPSDENDIVPQVLKAILNLPENTHVAVRYTSTQLIGEFHHWIEKHPEVLEPTLNFLLSCLHQPPLATVAATSLRNISSACPQQMGIHFQGLLQIVQVMDSFNISKTAAIGLLKGAALTLAKMPLTEISTGLPQLCQIQLTPLLEYLKCDGFSKDRKKIDPVVWMDRLTVIFKCMKFVNADGQTHPCVPIIQEIWPVLRDITNKCHYNFRIIDHFRHCMGDAIYTLGMQFSPLFEPLIKHVVLMYQFNQYPCLLNLGSVLVDEFGKDINCVKRLIEMLEAFCESIFPKCDGLDKLKRYPSNVEELFGLGASFLSVAPVPFLQSTIFKSIFRCGLVACALKNLKANAAVMKFFTAFVSRNWEKTTNNEAGDFECRVSLIQSTLAEHGRDLTCSLLYACFCYLPTELIQNVAEVLYELMMFDRIGVCHWLKSAIESLPKQNNGKYTIKANPKELSTFLDSVSRAQSGKTVNWCIMELICSRAPNTNSPDGRRNCSEWQDESLSSETSLTCSSSSSLCLSAILPSSSSAPSLWSSSSSSHLITE